MGWADSLSSWFGGETKTKRPPGRFGLRPRKDDEDRRRTGMEYEASEKRMSDAKNQNAVKEVEASAKKRSDLTKKQKDFWGKVAGRKKK